MPFDALPEQAPIFPPEAEEYSQRALELSREAAERCDVVLDVPYGGDPRQRVDVYRPANGGTGSLPTLLFAHGGAWTNGYKEWFGLLGPSLTSLPAVLVCVSYRLAPEHRYPAPFEDCVAALAWARDHIAEHGGDPDRIFVGGHSSGGSLFALVALRRDVLEREGLPPDAVKGCVPLSTRFNLVFGRPEPGSTEARHAATIFERGADAEAASPLHHVGGNSVPFLLAHGSHDLPAIVAGNEEMRDALRAEGTRVEHVVLAGSDHFDTALQIRDPDDPWTRSVRGWLSNDPRGRSQT